VGSGMRNAVVTHFSDCHPGLGSETWDSVKPSLALGFAGLNREKYPSGAKALDEFAASTARQKPRPFKTRLFRDPYMEYPSTCAHRWVVFVVVFAFVVVEDRAAEPGQVWATIDQSDIAGSKA